MALPNVSTTAGTPDYPVEFNINQSFICNNRFEKS